MTTAAPHAARTAVADLVLARLAVPSAKPPSPAAVRADVGRLAGFPLTPDDFVGLTATLLDGGLVERRPRSRNGVRLTDAGRAAALRFLGVDALPPGTNWKAVRDKFLFARAAGADAGRFDTADRLGAFLVRREYDLATGGTTRQALEALVCKLVGRPGEATLDGLFRAVLSEELGSDERLAADDLVKQFPRRLAGTTTGGLDDLRAAVVARWLRSLGGDDGPAAASPDLADEAGRDPEPLDLAEFAATVKRIARDCPAAGRFGAGRAFVAAVWRESQAEDGFPPMPLADFKAALAGASREGLIRLDPADMVQAMDPRLVAESETVRAGAAFHFILTEEPAS